MNKLLISCIDDDFIATPCYNIYIYLSTFLYISIPLQKIFSINNNILLQRKVKEKIFFSTLQNKLNL